MTPTQDLLTLAALAAGLVIASVIALNDAHAKEDAEAPKQREEAIANRIAAAFDDDHTCDMCHRVSAVRELVHLHDDAALCCAGCAELLKLNRLGRAA